MLYRSSGSTLLRLAATAPKAVQQHSVRSSFSNCCTSSPQRHRLYGGEPQDGSGCTSSIHYSLLSRQQRVHSRLRLPWSCIRSVLWTTDLSRRIATVTHHSHTNTVSVPVSTSKPTTTTTTTTSTTTPTATTTTIGNTTTTPTTATTTTSDHTLQWRNPPPFQLSYYRDLTKFKLSAFVALTTMAGYAMAPGAASVVSLLCTTGGTALCIASANALNQWTEAPYDAQMSRTRTRILVRHGMSPQHAFVAAVTAGVAGTAILAVTVNPITAVLGAANILLYTCIYTPMKRSSIANTWAGSVVGAIPPAMGWTACTGTIDPGALVLAAALYAWQFPHFNALSWGLRSDYAKAGYRMMCVTHPQLNARVALRYALAMFPICYAAYAIDMVSWLFLLDSSIVNAYMAWHAYFFWRSSNPQTARALFFASLVHLPVLLALLMIHKLSDTAVETEIETESESGRMESLINDSTHGSVVI
ncbi:hypothetical protein BASA50_003775 [Batrachochytrium salamandrivorans]|uniref:Heme O synthase n=1 Tax=Batrachochytrium salamandrivorans TaxID=1357716 RepID=A0ABQ8FEH9_9FUNG|nr:hypothetical protein BASA50_004712 [Batrachochytrium salamandrivorans]KAH6598353.1 hypothetical protein BASA50_003775 [Batrachochytrium salamandrivorans]KAH9248429.1 protoheme IX farnesyltransferase [Batrachochytrium salamandrivorans]